MEGEEVQAGYRVMELGSCFRSEHHQKNNLYIWRERCLGWVQSYGTRLMLQTRKASLNDLYIWRERCLGWVQSYRTQLMLQTRKASLNDLYIWRGKRCRLGIELWNSAHALDQNIIKKIIYIYGGKGVQAGYRVMELGSCYRPEKHH